MFHHYLSKSFYFLLFILGLQAAVSAQTTVKITAAKTTGSNKAELTLSNNRHILIDFYGENIFRLFIDSVGKTFREPEAKPAAQILVNQPRKNVAQIKLVDSDETISISSKNIHVIFEKDNSLFKIIDVRTNKPIVETIQPALFEKNRTSLVLKENPDEYFLVVVCKTGASLIKEKRSLLKIKTAGPMGAWHLLILFTGVPTDTALCGTHIKRESTISDLSKKVR
ncbi:hypothetical protein MKP09_17285 [Niabella ginsengisoli]|uniref:DUF4397 domain-containing protein n=1 Tax=Niabella ginsengisoli TaxID=522298 RepID=A0ABS9SMG6_9BACT|nr:hypothetical protein [Niabella ginsengisoli]MCH5599530.1 hypothetical protein [Niabella ginsengisoli]